MGKGSLFAVIFIVSVFSAYGAIVTKKENDLKRLGVHKKRSYDTMDIKPTDDYYPKSDYKSVSNYGKSGSNYGQVGSDYGKSGSNYGEVGSNYGKSGSNYGEVGSNYGKSGSNYGEVGSNYGKSRSNYWKSGLKSGSNYGKSGLKYGKTGSNYGKSGSKYGKNGGKKGKNGGKKGKNGGKKGKNGGKKGKNGGKKGKGKPGGGKYKGKGGKNKPSFDCVKNPCENEGICCQDGGYSRCICPAGFKGNQCEIDIDECARKPCPRGAKCFDQVNGFSCYFPDKDQECKQKKTDCSSSPCKNGGTCQPHKRGYKCECPAGFAGRNCQTDINECASGPCFNGGKCVDGVNSFSCTCLPGYVGSFCQTKQSDCSPDICMNDGECVIADASEGWSCMCKPGFAGKRCERVANDCSSSPCKNGGTCCEVGDGFVCQCEDGFSGETCEKRDEELNVPEGQGALIFKECGTDNPKSKRFSRKCRFDDEMDCVVCGRGYTLRTKSKKQVEDDLVKVCKFSKKMAKRVARAAGLSGTKAKACFKKYKLGNVKFTKDQQKRLFQRDFQREEHNADAYLQKRCKKGFKINKLKGFIKDLTVDLFREGDFKDDTPQSKDCAQRIEQDIQSNDMKRIKSLLSDRDFWIKKMNVKPWKFEYRKNACQSQCQTYGC